MAVTFSLPTVLARLADGHSTIEADGTTLGDAVAQIADRCPAHAPRRRDPDGGPYPFVTFYLNDEDIRFQNGFATPVAEGDEITVVAAIAGG
jgi:molybdopterin converting factor small subunit